MVKKKITALVKGALLARKSNIRTNGPSSGDSKTLHKTIDLSPLGSACIKCLIVS